MVCILILKRLTILSAYIEKITIATPAETVHANLGVSLIWPKTFSITSRQKTNKGKTHTFNYELEKTSLNSSKMKSLTLSGDGTRLQISDSLFFSTKTLFIKANGVLGFWGFG